MEHTLVQAHELHKKWHPRYYHCADRQASSRSCRSWSKWWTVRRVCWCDEALNCWLLDWLDNLSLPNRIVRAFQNTREREEAKEKKLEKTKRKKQKRWRAKTTRSEKKRDREKRRDEKREKRRNEDNTEREERRWKRRAMREDKTKERREEKIQD